LKQPVDTARGKFHAAEAAMFAGRRSKVYSRALAVALGHALEQIDKLRDCRNRRRRSRKHRRVHTNRDREN
jgi:hypothetical protein